MVLNVVFAYETIYGWLGKPATGMDVLMQTNEKNDKQGQMFEAKNFM